MRERTDSSPSLWSHLFRYSCFGILIGGCGWKLGAHHHEISYSMSTLTSEPVTHQAILPVEVNMCLLHIANVRDVKLYSQNDEDGAILQTLKCLGGHGTKEYFEFGTENGMEINTRILRDVYGWHGHLLDGGNENPKINLHKEFFTPSNIVSLLQKYKVSKTLDLLSIDCDFDDFWVMREILLGGYRPRVLLTEYNTNFGDEWAVAAHAKPVGKESTTSWRFNCYYGASAEAFFLLAKVFGYTPVWGNTVNLIFVRKDIAIDMGLAIPPVENIPGPWVRALHHECNGKTWKSIDVEYTSRAAADKSVSHAKFANGYADIKLGVKTFSNKGKTELTWRGIHKIE